MQSKRKKDNEGSSFYSDNGTPHLKNNLYSNPAPSTSQQIPEPPNDKVIHVSQCKNDMCPLKEATKQNQGTGFMQS